MLSARADHDQLRLEILDHPRNCARGAAELNATVRLDAVSLLQPFDLPLHGRLGVLGQRCIVRLLRREKSAEEVPIWRGVDQTQVGLMFLCQQSCSSHCNAGAG